MGHCIIYCGSGLSLASKRAWSIVIRLGVFVLEVSLLTSLGGASAGQRVMGLRVLSWPDNLFLRPGPILLRTILIALVIPAVVTDKDGRGLHDRAAKSVVMRVSKKRT